MSVSDMNFTKAQVRRNANPAHSEPTGFLAWPIFGILIAFFCTILWCVFLLWILI
jgi:hypothetical protein